MKKIISYLLAAVMLFTLMTALSGCLKITLKSTSERFNDALKAIGEELRIGPCSEQFRTEGANAVDSSVTVSAPGILGGDDITLRLTGTGDRETDSFSSDVTVSYRDSSIEAKLELLDGEDAYLSFPEVSEDYVHASFGALTEKLGNGFEKIGSLADLAKIADRLGGLVEKYSDGRVTAENADAEIFGEKVGCEKLTLKLERADAVEIAKELADILNGFSDGENADPGDEIPEDAAFTVSLYTLKGGTVRAEAEYVADGKVCSTVYELAAADGGVKARLNVTETDGETEKSMTPFLYEHTKDGDGYAGSAVFERSDGDGERTAAVSFTGTETPGSADFVYNISAGQSGTGSGSLLRVTANRREDGGVEFVSKLDARDAGVTVSATAAVKTGTFERGSYDPGRSIEYKEDMSDKDRTKLRELGFGVLKKAGDFVRLFGPLMGGGSWFEKFPGGIKG